MSRYPGPVVLGFGTSTRRSPAKFTEPAHLSKLRSVKACLEISAIRNVWAAASRAIVHWKNGACLVEDSDGSIRVSGKPAFPPPVWTQSCYTECDACAHARGCKQLLLSSIFLFCCLALSSQLSVFLASKRERCWGRWRRWIWGLQTSLSGRARSAWHRLLSLLAKAPSLVDNCTFRDRIDKNVAGGSSCLRTHSSLCARPAALQLQQLSGRSSLQWYSTVGLHRDNDLTGSVDHAQCCTLHATAQS